MLRTPPFLRAPLLLFSRPAVLITVIGATAILGMVAALTPLFLSSASSAALQQELAGRCPASFGGQVSNYDSPDVVREDLTAATSDDPAFLPPRLYLEGALITGTNASGEGLTIPFRFTARDEFRDHIELVEGEHGPGAYIDDVAARDLAAAPATPSASTFKATGTSSRSRRCIGAFTIGLQTPTGVSSRVFSP